MKKYVAVVAALAAVIVVAVWVLYSRKDADATVKSSSLDTTVVASALPPAPASPSVTPPSKVEPPRRTVMSSTYTVPDASLSPTASGVATTDHNATASGTPADKTHSRSDAEVLNNMISPTGDPEDEFDTDKLMHNRLATEKRDDDWASQAEEQLRNYLTANMGPERLTLVSVQCASSVCEILAATVVPGNLAADMADWQHLLIGMARQPWWAEYQFNQPRASFHDTPDHQRGLFIAFITRIAVQG